VGRMEAEGSERKEGEKMTDQDRQKLAAAMEAGLRRIDAERRRLRAEREASEWVPDMFGRQLVSNPYKFDSPALRDFGNG